MTDIVRIMRVLEYVGPRNYIEQLVKESIHGTKAIEIKDERNARAYITGVTVGEFPEVLIIKKKEENTDEAE